MGDSAAGKSVKSGMGTFDWCVGGGCLLEPVELTGTPASLVIGGKIQDHAIRAREKVSECFSVRCFCFPFVANV